MAKSKQLVVVESPTKAKTIERYLGEGFRVVASYGHIRDLPKSDFAVVADDGGDVHLTYEVTGASKKHVATLKKEARDADRVWLALDLDREGEAIAWHVAEVLGIDLDEPNRVVFDEITADAIRAAFSEPRPVNRDLVDAQQARRAVDRIVGYRLSPVLWRTVSAGISAGRVQSVALRIIVDREDEIRAFVEQEYWSFDGRFAVEGGGDKPVGAGLHSVGGRRLATPRDLEKAAESKSKDESDYLLIGDADAAEALRERCESVSRYTVRDVERSERKRNPAPPFTTSTLQQEAARKLSFSAKRTMRLAQQLYEGVNLGEEGPTGLITYMRTDSVNIADQALREISALVGERFGDRYSLDKPRRYKGKQKRAQEAHEAIRPTSARRHPDDLRGVLDKDQHRLYELIWKRTVATQMAPAVFDRLSANIVGAEPDGEEIVFRATGQVLKFDGFIKVYVEGRDDDDDVASDEDSDELPELEEGQLLSLEELQANQHFTQPPPRYTEATLVKTLEAEGIGRPSTYASIISTLADREYVRIESRRFFPTPLGEVVTAFLKSHFSEVVDVGFTARMEEELDEIASGDEEWDAMVRDFLGEVDEWVRDRKPERPRLPLVPPADCPECAAPMEKVFSGKTKQWFASCSKWPECEGTLPLDEHGHVTDPEPEPEPDPRVLCPECEKPMLPRSGRFGEFYGCQDYPKCKGIVNVAARTPFHCPKCGDGRVDMRKSRYGKPFAGCSNYPDCDFAVWAIPLREPCPQCGAPMKPPPKNRKLPIATCANPEDPHKIELDDFEQPRVVTVPAVPGAEGLDPDLPGYEGPLWDEVAAQEDGEAQASADGAGDADADSSTDEAEAEAAAEAS
jgi:DNA topoisomerase I